MLVAALLLAVDLRLELVRHSLTGTHYRYREYIAGLPSDNYVTSRSAVAPATASVAPATDTPVSDYATPLRNVNGRVARRVIRDHVAYDYDAMTGALLRTIPIFFRGKPARVFDPNPVASLNDPALQDRNDTASAVPDRAYRAVELQDVAASGPLRGPNVSLIDRQPPNTAPPDASGSLLFDRAADGFEDVNAYFHIDRNQRYLQSLGYVGERSIAAYPIEVDAHAGGGSDNSFFLPSLTAIGRGTLSFGEGGTDDAEDADILIHEYGHAILEWIAPGSFAGSFASQARALAEGFGDYWAFSQHAAVRVASGRDPYCFADWDARCAEDDPSQQCGYAPGSDCLRRLDSALTMADYDVREQSGTEHRNGSIWSSALRELHERVGKSVADTIILESIFDLPPLPTFNAAAHRIVVADEELFGGAHVADICEVMSKRGIVADCAFVPRGELTHFQSNDHGLAIPDNDTTGITSSLTIVDPRAIEELFVRVDIAHSSRGDLRLELIAPDGTIVLLKETSVDGGHDVHATFGINATSAQPLTIFRGRSAAGVWKLRVRDLRPRDVGTLRSWDLVVKFAGAVPAVTRPRRGKTQMIPVVAHLFGVGATEFASDVRIANIGAEPRAATLIFTRSGEDGRTSFAAFDVALAPRQTIAFDDVVGSAFLTAGSGSLEVLGDVIAMSRTYAVTPLGTIGQQVPPHLETTTLGAPSLLVTPMIAEARFNLGITEVGGARGLVRVNDREITIEPFSHVQFPVPYGTQQVSVVSGDARVVTYLSQIDAATDDPMFIPALAVPSTMRTVIAPAISAEGVNGTNWRTDLWLTSNASDTSIAIEAIGAQRPSVQILLQPITTFEDVLARLFHRTITIAALRMSLPPGTLGATRTRTDGFSEFVPLLSVEGDAEENLLFIESGTGYRTNLGIISDEPALAELVIYDAAGHEVQRTTLATPGGVAQTAVTARVVNGRAEAHFLSGRGHAYASLIDNGTGDATFVH